MTEDNTVYGISRTLQIVSLQNELEQLNTRIAELEAKLKEPKSWFTRKYVDGLHVRIAELEVAQQWHPASEPPAEDGEYEVVRYIDTPMRQFLFWRENDWFNKHNWTVPGITHYRKAMPMPERDA